MNDVFAAATALVALINSLEACHWLIFVVLSLLKACL